MENKLEDKEIEIQRLQNRVVELEKQLIEAKAVLALHDITVPGEPPQGFTYQQSQEDLSIGDDRFRQAILVAPYPLMIRREDGKVVMINTAWAEITGYTLEDIPTIAEWARKAYGDQGPQRQALILNEGFSQPGVKKWGEFEVTTRTGEKRIWDFSTASLGVDESGKQLVMSMAVDVTERAQAEEMLRAARDEAMWLARLPGENPNPVARVSNEGAILYHNLVAGSLPGWRFAIHESLSISLRRLLQQALAEGRVVEQDVSFGQQIYAVTIVPISGEHYANIYGRDVTAHRHAEEALKESERRQREIARLLELDQSRLAAILRHLPVGVWIVDQQGCLTGSNPEADRIWAGEAPLLNSIAEYQKYVSWHPGSGELLKSEEYPVAVVLRTGSPVNPMEINIRRFDGSEGTVLASAAPIRNNQGQLMGVVGVNVDITERKHVEAHINDLLALNEKILNHSSVGILTYKVTGQCVFANEKVASIVGTGVAQLATQNFHTIAAWKKSGLYDLVQQAISTQAPVTADIHHVSTFGKDSWMTVHCITFKSKGEDHVLLSMSDITERKQAERALKESEQRLNRAQEIAHLGSWELDLATNQLTWSDEVYRIFGLQPQEFGATYEAFLEAVHPDDRAAVDAAYSGSIQAGRDQYEIEHRVIKRSNGEVRIVHEKCEHIRNQEGQIVRSVGMVHDITERKRAEEQLKDYAERLERSNRELEQFAFMASHDLQEPLRKIEMFGDLLLERALSLNDRERAYLDRMRNAAGRMREMVRGLLQLSSVTTQGRPFVSVDLSQITAEVLSDMEEKIQRIGGRVECSALPIVEGDPVQLRQLMQNLIGNALKYHRPEVPPDVNIYAKPLSEKVQILVEDRGIGFNQEDAERIFQPFQRLVGRSQYEGNGIGLAICRRIVERHVGNIIALSKPGQGTTFIVTLPIGHPEDAKNGVGKDIADETPGVTPGR